MEEKLYFKPANYGKGKKKEQTEQKSEPKTNKNHKALKLVIVLLILAIVVAVIIWLLRGKTTTAGQYPANVRNESLSCSATDKAYEPANRVSSDNKELKIDMIFYGAEKLSAMSLKYTLTFASNEEAYSAEAFNRAGFNLGLQERGFSSGLFNNKFSLMDNILVLTLRADADEIEEEELTREYFLLDRSAFPKNLSDFRKHYESAGFTCASTIDNK